MKVQLKEIPHWYKINVDERVREIVYELRNAGINTTNSCGCNKDEWTVEADCLDPTTELRSIYNVMDKLNVKSYNVTIIATLEPAYSNYREYMRISGWYPK